ncbi:MAG: TetR/AcrR family transcriptional regulator, partial [Pseudoflavonifractor sp.]
KILETMYFLVAEKGYDKASIGQIAAAIGIQKASIYYYFKSKEDIFLALVQALHQNDYSGNPALLTAALLPDAYREALIAMGEHFIDSYFEHQTLRKVYAEIDIQTTRIAALKDFIGDNDRRFSAFLAACMAHGAEIGAFPHGADTALNAQVLYTALIGIDQAVLYDLPIAPRAVWRAVVAGLFDGREQL